MAVTNPPVFIQAGSHPAEDVRRLFRALFGLRGGIITSGSLTVQQNGTPNMSVNVTAGEVVIPGTQDSNQGYYYCENRSTLNVAISAADATNARKDLVIANVKDSDYSGSDDEWEIRVVTGTPAASPSEPSLSSYPNSWVLALVDVPANDTAIGTAQITDRRTTGTGQKGRASALGGIIVCTSTNRPASPTEGMAIYETDTDVVKVYDGSSWVDPKNLLAAQTGLSARKSATGTAGVGVSAGNSYFTQAVSFPETFATTPKVVVGLKQANSGSIAVVAGVTSVTTTGCSIYVRSGDDGNSGGSATYDVDWIAVG